MGAGGGKLCELRTLPCRTFGSLAFFSTRRGAEGASQISLPREKGAGVKTPDVSGAYGTTEVVPCYEPFLETILLPKITATRAAKPRRDPELSFGKMCAACGSPGAPKRLAVGPGRSI